MLALINDLLDLSAIESGADELHPANLNVREITGHVITHLQSLWTKKNTRVETDFQVAFLRADPKRVEQVLTNLIDNAVKYCPAGSAVRIAWAQESNEIVLRVSDNGPGIGEKYLERLFERFYRLDKGRSREMGGTGLGLSIVKHIMQRHNGSVTAESALGQGTTFVCRFPALIPAS